MEQHETSNAAGDTRLDARHVVDPTVAFALGAGNYAAAAGGGSSVPFRKRKNCVPMRMAVEAIM